MRIPQSIKPASVRRHENLVDTGAAAVRESSREPAHVEFSLWMDQQLESLEENFRAYTTRNSLVESLGR